MNVIIVIAVPVAKVVLLWVAGGTIELASCVSDYTLIAFTIIFNVGAYITDKISDTSRNEPQAIAEDVAEKLIESNNMMPAREIVSGFLNKLSQVLTDDTKKHFEEKHKKTKEKESKMKTYVKYMYFFAAICLLFFAGISLSDTKDLCPLVTVALLLTILLFSSLAIWALLNRNSKENFVDEAQEQTRAQEQASPKTLSGDSIGLTEKSGEQHDDPNQS